jgi:hypothetical protein
MQIHPTRALKISAELAAAERERRLLSREYVVRNIDWSEQVQVKRLVPDEIVWDGIRLDEAVKRIVALPPDKRAGLTIFAPSGLYSGEDIEALFDKLPRSK